jgi:ATP-binding cassette, subfamily B, bacterial
MAFKFFKQLDSSDCGPACLKMISQHYGKNYSIDYLRRISFITKEGVSLLTISKAAERIGFKTLKLELTHEYLVETVPLPCILYWNQEHFVVLRDIKNGTNPKKARYSLADPGVGMVTIDAKTFMKSWTDVNTARGVVLALEPTDEFFNRAEDAKPAAKNGFSYLLKYFLKYKKFFFQLCIGLLAGSMLSLIFPFLTQSMVDYGIGNGQINFIMIILLFQLMLFLGTTSIEYLRSHLLLHISTRINITILSDFLIKLMKLPMAFFESRRTGDIMQRIEDHRRIEEFLTRYVLNTLFSIVNLVIWVIVIAIYNEKILFIFLAGGLLAIGWNLAFMKKIKENDYKLFNFFARNRDDLYEIIHGIDEIKLNDFELHRRWKWETTQLGLFNLNVKVLKLSQYQRIGSSFFIQLMNILITYVSAREVLNGNITLGAMLTIAYIIGQMVSPIEQLSVFFNAAQQARISLERMNEVHTQLNEEDDSKIIPNADFLSTGIRQSVTRVNNDGDLVLPATDLPGIQLKNVSFQYEGPGSPYVLKNINLHIPLGKTTAIVGSSGSGKTTLLKLLLKFYDVEEGEVSVNRHNLRNLSARWWRNRCGTVMQEGYIFYDTIEKNISTGSEHTNLQQLAHACRIANIESFIETLPLGYETKIGGAGLGLSAGQKQRLLIARAIYKNPDVLLFDEATSALDAKNEREIVDKLKDALDGKTVIVVAHRLSTVKNADKIVVLENGEIVEEGSHAELVKRKDRYFNLIKNQLELGS